MSCPTDVFKYKVIGVADSADERLDLKFSEATDFIRQAVQSGGKVYVHCQAGG